MRRQLGALTAALLAVTGCAIDAPYKHCQLRDLDSCTIAYPQLTHRYGHTYYGIVIEGTTK